MAYIDLYAPPLLGRDVEDEEATTFRVPIEDVDLYALAEEVARLLKHDLWLERERRSLRQAR
ncbi:MAG: hypothetical protein JXD18_02085 [Anaerolineae bacterium]|nr:hypothetical protein [Anaerolineae bacterium]